MRIEDLVYYCPDSPSGLRWKVDRFANRRLLAAKGSVVGSRRLRGHWQVKLGGKMLLTHRIVWELANGPLQHFEQIDHIDQNPSNNKLENLRKVSRTLNMRNRPMQKNNASGTTGVSLCCAKGKSYWVAQWSDLTGKRKNAWYSVLEHGTALARQMAVERRNSELESMNLAGAGYTATHGSNK